MKQKIKLYCKLLNQETQKCEIYQLRLTSLVAYMKSFKADCEYESICAKDFHLPMAVGFNLACAIFKIAGSADAIMRWEKYTTAREGIRLNSLRRIHTTIEGAANDCEDDLAFRYVAIDRYAFNDVFDTKDIEIPSAFSWYRSVFYSSYRYSLQSWKWDGTKAIKAIIKYSDNELQCVNSDKYPLYDFVSEKWYYDKTTKYYETELECYKDNHIAVHVFKDDEED